MGLLRTAARLVRVCSLFAVVECHQLGGATGAVCREVDCPSINTDIHISCSGWQ